VTIWLVDRKAKEPRKNASEFIAKALKSNRIHQKKGFQPQSFMVH